MRFEENPFAVSGVSREREQDSFIHQALSQAVFEQAPNVVSGVRELLPHQEDFVGHIIEYIGMVVEAREQKRDILGPRMARIEAAPRTGKTTIAAETLRRLNLRGVFLVPSSNLVGQVANEFRLLLPEKRIAKYSGKEKESFDDADVVVATYQMSQADMRTKGALPDAFRSFPIVFADEGHESTTDQRMHIMREGFHSDAIRIALSGTPNYSETRRLKTYYPDLIHAMQTPEAVELGLISPFQYWVYELDIDGSSIDITKGDFNPVDVGRVYTGLPVLKFVQLLRYHPSNKDIPALICCRTKQQALDVASYLDRVKPEGAKKIQVITEDTKKRDELLLEFPDTYDTFVTVDVLVRGWSAADCKLLIDCDPTLSPVRAGQKFTRPLTKDGVTDERVGKMYSVIPARLKYQPLFPPDVLVEREAACPPGHVYGKTKAHKRPDPHIREPLPNKIEDVDVRPLAHIRDHGGLQSIHIDRTNTKLLQNIVLSGYARVGETEPEIDREAWLTETLWTYRTFQSTFFQHPAFTGYGRLLLWSIGIRDREQFQTFITHAFPEQRAHMLLVEQSSSRLGYLENRRRGIQGVVNTEPIAQEHGRLMRLPKNQDERQAAREVLRTLFGFEDETALHEKEVFLLKYAEEAYTALGPKERDLLHKILIEEYMLADVAEQEGVSRTAVKNRYDSVLEKIRKSIYSKLDSPITREHNAELLAALQVAAIDSLKYTKDKKRDSAKEQGLGVYQLHKTVMALAAFFAAGGSSRYQKFAARGRAKLSRAVQEGIAQYIQSRSPKTQQYLFDRYVEKRLPERIQTELHIDEGDVQKIERDTVAFARWFNRGDQDVRNLEQYFKRAFVLAVGLPFSNPHTEYLDTIIHELLVELSDRQRNFLFALYIDKISRDRMPDPRSTRMDDRWLNLNDEEFKQTEMIVEKALQKFKAHVQSA